MNSKETLGYLIKNKSSCVRFGDGEMTTIVGREHYFSKPNVQLSKRLVEVLSSDDSSLLVCVPSFLNEISSNGGWWKANLLFTRKYWNKYLNHDEVYGDARISRLNDGAGIRGDVRQVMGLWKELFVDQDIVMVEGNTTRFGMGNDLFEGAKKVRRILCPDVDAFDWHDQILKTCLRQNKNVLFLVALGQAAKPLVFDLASKGYRAIDVGHLDITYEWFLRGGRVKVPGKKVAEMKGDDELGLFDNDELYLKQTIAKIES
ncbi:MAG: GT-D fold domain-containing protein [Candidatus Nomurabacteria bacterium]|jgi:glycosyltransferase family protein|nr:GT-D fold domain-containing protein [Candidatus Nomurabacteria bacterium]